MTEALPTLPLTFLLLTMQLLPPLPFYFGAATSMALGTTAAGATVVLIVWLYVALSKTRPIEATLDFAGAPTLAILFMIAMILAHSIVADDIATSDLTRLAESCVPLAFMMAGGIIFGNVLQRSSDRAVNSAVRWSMRLLLVIIALALVRLVPLADQYPKSAFPFTETSHYALAFTPILMYHCVQANGARRLRWLFAGFALGLVLQSLALLVGCLLTAAACRKLGIMVGLAVVLLMAGLPLGASYFTSRLDFSGSVMNLSNLVYVQGWQMLAESMTRSHGWGLGFSQLGLRGTNVPAADLVRLLQDGADSNLTDGSFVFSKLVSEFGFIGIALSAAFVIGASRCVIKLRSDTRNLAPRAATFARCIVVSYVVDMFIRGPGYFVQSSILFVAAVAALTDRPEILRRIMRSCVPVGLQRHAANRSS